MAEYNGIGALPSDLKKLNPYDGWNEDKFKELLHGLWIIVEIYPVFHRGQIVIWSVHRKYLVTF